MLINRALPIITVMVLLSLRCIITLSCRWQIGVIRRPKLYGVFVILNLVFNGNPRVCGWQKQRLTQKPWKCWQKMIYFIPYWRPDKVKRSENYLTKNGQTVPMIISTQEMPIYVNCLQVNRLLFSFMTVVSPNRSPLMAC